MGKEGCGGVEEEERGCEALIFESLVLIIDSMCAASYSRYNIRATFKIQQLRGCQEM